MMPWTSEDAKRWVPNWAQLVEERVKAFCVECGTLTKLRAMRFPPHRKYGYGFRTFRDQYWYDDAAITVTEPLCREHFDAVVTVRELDKLVNGQ